MPCSHKAEAKIGGVATLCLWAFLGQKLHPEQVYQAKAVIAAVVVLQLLWWGCNRSPVQCTPYSVLCSGLSLNFRFCDV